MSAWCNTPDTFALLLFLLFKYNFKNNCSRTGTSIQTDRHNNKANCHSSQLLNNCNKNDSKYSNRNLDLVDFKVMRFLDISSLFTN